MKRTRKTMALALAGALLATPAWGAEQVAPISIPAQVGVPGGENPVFVMPKRVTLADLAAERRQAVAKIAGLVPELQDLLDQGFYLEEYSYGWGLHLHDLRVDPAKEFPSNAFLEFDGKTNQLLQYQMHHPDWAGDATPKGEEAIQKAQEFVAAVMGEGLKDYRLSGQVGHGGGGGSTGEGKQIHWTYGIVRWERLVHGIPVLNEYDIRVMVDAAGHIHGFERDFGRYRQAGYRELDVSLFPDPALALPAEKAHELYAAGIKMTLMYNSGLPLALPGGSDGPVETKPALIYVPAGGDFYLVDAMTGERYKEFGIPGFGEPFQAEVVGRGKGVFIRNQAEGEKWLKESFGVDFTGMEFDTHTIETVIEPVNKQVQYNWTHFPKPDGEGNLSPLPIRSIFLNVDGETGQILSASLGQGSTAAAEPRVSEAEARKTALDFIAKYIVPAGQKRTFQVQPITSPGSEEIPDWVDKTKVRMIPQPEPRFTYLGSETWQGVPTDSSFSVEVDRVTGQILGWSTPIGIADGPLPDKALAVSPETAKTEYLRTHPLRLGYIWPNYQGQLAPAPRLVYFPDPRPAMGYIDALTGKTVSLLPE